MDTLIQDIRYAVRSLGKSPWLVVAVVLSLALGIGANTTIFSLVNAIALRPLPSERPEELVSVFTSESNGARWGTSCYPDYVDFRDRTHSFAGLATYSVTPLSLASEDGRGRRYLGAVASGNFFTMLGVHAAQGRMLQPADDGAPGANPVVVLSHGMWQRKFMGNPALVGSPIRINGHAFTVVGVLPESFRGVIMGITPDLWVTASMSPLANPSSDMLTQRGNRSNFVIGRLAPGVTAKGAEAEMNVVMRQLGIEHPAADSGRFVTVVPEREARVFPAIRGPVMGFMALLLVVVALVLLVACTNVAGLMLARATARRREIGIRLALGASRRRLITQLVTESVMLSLAGGGLGMLLALWGTDLLLAFQPPLPFDLALDLRPDGRVLVFTLVISVLTGIVFGLVPALESVRSDVMPALRDESSGRRRSRVRNGLVIAQIALSTLLLAGAGLFVRGLRNAYTLDPGFDPRHVIAMSFDLELQGYDRARGAAFQREVLGRVASLPGVESVAFAEHLPLGLGRQIGGVVVEGHVPADGHLLEIHCSAVSPGYFATLRVPIIRGREFSATDQAGSPGVAIVNETFARRFWPGQNPIGKRITRDTSGEGGWLEVVGVARDAKYNTLNEDPLPYFYESLTQSYSDEVTLAARSRGAAPAMTDRIQDVIKTLDPTLPVYDIKTLEAHMGVSLLPARLVSVLLGGFGVLALLLSGIGLMGVVSYFASQRTREIGIRMALGALPAHVLALVVGHGMRLAAVGLALGIAAALGVTHFVQGFLYGVSPADPLTFLTILVVLAVVTLVAAWLPARRAARVDPMIALRHE